MPSVEVQSLWEQRGKWPSVDSLGRKVTKNVPSVEIPSHRDDRKGRERLERRHLEPAERLSDGLTDSVCDRKLVL